MTEDNVIGLIVGLVLIVVSTCAIFNIPRLTRVAKTIFSRTYGSFWARRVSAGFVVAMVVLLLASGVASTILAIVGGFNASG